MLALKAFAFVLEACAFSPFSHAGVSRFLCFRGFRLVVAFSWFSRVSWFSGFRSLHGSRVFAFLRFSWFSWFRDFRALRFSRFRDVRRCSLQVVVVSMLNGLVF